jgi:hypothetical protein
MTSRMSCHRRCCSRVDAGRARSRAPITLIIAYSQNDLHLGVLFFFFFFFLFLAGHGSYMYLSTHQDDVRIAHFSTTMITSTLTSATLALRGYHLHVVLVDFYSSHNIRAITMLQLRGDVSSSDSTFDIFSSLTICGAPTVNAGDVRVYLVGYIFCIIDCHIYQDIFGIIDIMYYRLQYVSGGIFPLKTLVLYIYWPRGTM